MSQTRHEVTADNSWLILPEMLWQYCLLPGQAEPGVITIDGLINLVAIRTAMSVFDAVPVCHALPEPKALWSHCRTKMAAMESTSVANDNAAPSS